MQMTNQEQESVMSFILMHGMSLMYQDGYILFMPSTLVSACRDKLDATALEVMATNDFIFAYRSEDRREDLSGLNGLLFKIVLALGTTKASLKDLVNANKKWMSQCVRRRSSAHAFILINTWG